MVHDREREAALAKVPVVKKLGKGGLLKELL